MQKKLFIVIFQILILCCTVICNAGRVELPIKRSCRWVKLSGNFEVKFVDSAYCGESDCLSIEHNDCPNMFTAEQLRDMCKEDHSNCTFEFSSDKCFPKDAKVCLRVSGPWKFSLRNGVKAIIDGTMFGHDVKYYFFLHDHSKLSLKDVHRRIVQVSCKDTSQATLTNIETIEKFCITCEDKSQVWAKKILSPYSSLYSYGESQLNMNNVRCSQLYHRGGGKARTTVKNIKSWLYCALFEAGEHLLKDIKTHYFSSSNCGKVSVQNVKAQNIGLLGSGTGKTVLQNVKIKDLWLACGKKHKMQISGMGETIHDKIIGRDYADLSNFKLICGKNMIIRDAKWKLLETMFVVPEIVCLASLYHRGFDIY